jgi:hypothetical protein
MLMTPLTWMPRRSAHHIPQVNKSVATYAVLVGGSNGDGAWRGLVRIVESIDPRPYKIDLSISEVDLDCNLFERPSMNSSKSKSPFDPPTRTA